MKHDRAMPVAAGVPYSLRVTWQWIVTTVFAGIGAVLGLLNEFRRHRDRPRPDVMARYQRRTIEFLDKGKTGAYMGGVKNLGDATARNVTLTSDNCEVSPGKFPLIADELAPGDVAEFDFDCDQLDEAWVTVTWTSGPQHRRRQYVSWSPLTYPSEVALIREAQTHFSFWRRLAIRALAGPVASPYTISSVSFRSDRRVVDRLKRTVQRVDRNGMRMRVARRLSEWRPSYLTGRDPQAVSDTGP